MGGHGAGADQNDALTQRMINCRMAGMPSGVAGTLIITLGRLTAFQRRCASSSVPFVSRASVGDTSMLTYPSRFLDLS